MPHTTINAYAGNMINQTQEVIGLSFQIAGVILLFAVGASLLFAGIWSAARAKITQGDPTNPHPSRPAIWFVLAAFSLGAAGYLMFHWWA
ncbi:hypothetical protein ccrud_14400 (plasmid) [Corynebacterium crudilactis]|uniref:Uncharacterized protein n=1 Tax=Corynebacterium crudilactis TaxID=1652495 RepID=A0A172QY10_9CORY|nr:hypothetical protein ccrud_14400 [Corynebacterium crudilactis]